MSNVFLNAVQLNTSIVNANIPTHSVKKKFNNAVHELYQSIHAFTYPVSGGEENYTFEVVLWRAGGIGSYNDLLNKEKEIYDELNAQVVNFNPIVFRTNDTKIYLNYYGVNLIFESTKYISRASDGVNFISLTFDAIVHSPFIDTSQISGLTGSSIADYMVGAG